MSSLESLVDLLSLLSTPQKFSAQLATLREATASADAAKRAMQDLEVAKHKAMREIEEAQKRHDAATTGMTNDSRDSTDLQKRGNPLGFCFAQKRPRRGGVVGA